MFFVVVLIACTPKDQAPAVQPEISPEELIQKNQGRVKTEENRIEAFIRRRGWNMTETGTGLRYEIYEGGKGVAAEAGMKASLKYVISLLNGEVVYQSDEASSFKIGKDEVESGLHEGVLMMRVGDKARMILPPHLAHGLTGDRERIPSNATLVFDVELIDLEE